MANKKRKCSQCKGYKIADDGVVFQNTFYCDVECATKKAFNGIQKGRDITHKVKKKKLKDNDRKIRMPAAQAAFNKFIRLRDKDLVCISCLRTNEQVGDTDSWKVGGAWDCGHFLTRGAFPELRFEELNAHKQCKSCNGGSDKYAKKTQLVRDDYRINLIDKIGLDKVEWLEGKHEPKKYTCEELKEIELKYKALVKKMPD